jgi:pimeloyl-ACP methyl ester carboxylesterase
VPLDHFGGLPGRLSLHVAVSGPARAPRGTLLFLTGGPGEAGVAFMPKVRARLGAALRGYRLVMLDQRGTGAGALRCPALQRAAGASDLAVPPLSAVRSCAAAVGPRRRFFTTRDTVADLDALRDALGPRRWAVDGVSYGTFVAERYALAHPDRVSRLVLDSVVPQEGIGPFQLETIKAVPRVLRAACRERRCGRDPAADLAAVIRARHDGPALLDTLVTLSVADPSYRAVPGALAAARAGDPRRLERLIAAVHRGDSVPATFLSQGLHASTLCEDYAFPWGGPEAPLTARRRAIAKSAASLTPRTLWPFDRATALGNGELRTCENWPPVGVKLLSRQAVSASLPSVPVLLLAGDRDLSTPLAWGRAEAKHAPQGRLVVVHGAGHSVQTRARNPAVRAALNRFLQR